MAQAGEMVSRAGSLAQERVQTRPAQSLDAVIRDGLANIYHPSRFTESPFLAADTFGLGFWLLFATVFAVEFIDIILGVVELFGYVTVVIGIAIHMLVMFLSLLVAIFEFLYFYFHNVPSNVKGEASANTRIIVATIVKFIPVIGDFIPSDSITLLLTRWSVNRAIKKAKSLREQEEAEAEAEAQQFVARVTQSMQAA